jgi:hypothetical protein
MDLLTTKHELKFFKLDGRGNNLDEWEEALTSGLIGTSVAIRLDQGLSTLDFGHAVTMDDDGNLEIALEEENAPEDVGTSFAEYKKKLQKDDLKLYSLLLNYVPAHIRSLMMVDSTLKGKRSGDIESDPRDLS